METIEQQLCDIREAYAIGRLKPVVKIANNAFQGNYPRRSHSRLTAEQKLLVRCDQYYTEARQAARQGEYAQAENVLVMAEKLIQTQKFSQVSHLIALSAYEAAAAYLDSRRGDFGAGAKRIHHALALDETLIETHGYTSLHIHRMRLLLDLVGLKRQSGDEGEAFHMSFALANHLEQKTLSLPCSTSCNVSYLEQVPLAQKNFLFEQTMLEIVFLLAGQMRIPDDFLLVFNEHMSLTSPQPCLLSPRSHEWLQARQALQTGDPVRFLALACPLITVGPDDAPWLWSGILIDLAHLCRELSSSQTHLLLQDIRRDMLDWNWSQYPSSWRSLFRELSVQHI